MIVFLIGFMGSGKSTLGKAVQSAGNIPFIDLDNYIVVRAGKPIPAIFEEGGEALFRQKETEALKSLIAANPQRMLVACGGGTPCHGNNMELMNQAGLTLYLQTPVDELYHRLLPQRAQRPLIQHLNEQELQPFIEQLLKKREAYYLQAQQILAPEAQHADHLLRIFSDHSSHTTST